MLKDLLKFISPQTLADDIKNNILLTQQVLSKFAAYQSFGAALTESQQIAITNNLDKLDTYFKSKSGKELLSMLGEDFENFVKA